MMNLRTSILMRQIAWLIVASVFFAMVIACGGGGSTAVVSRSSAPTNPGESATKREPASQDPEASLESKLAALSGTEQRYARAAIAGTIGILDPATMNAGNMGHLPPIEVFQVAGEETILARADDELFFVTGIDTSNIVDGRRYDLGERVFLVVGTQRYTTAVGSTKQVFSLLRIDTPVSNSIVENERQSHLERVVEYNQAKAEEKRAAEEKALEEKAAQVAAKEAADLAAKRRTWKSADGKFTVEAEFISFGNGVLKLRRLDNGKEIIISENVLSADDKAWILARLRG